MVPVAERPRPDSSPRRALRILLVHNYYQNPGGEDGVFRAEGKLLRDRGHEVITDTVRNDVIAGMGTAALLSATVWNRDTYRRLGELIQTHRPDVLHAHNTFPLISPSAYAAARAERVPVVQTLHNYRLICANGLLLRNGVACERCVGRAVPWPAVTGRCYRDSAAASAAAAGMVWLHRARGTWAGDVDAYIALTAFARDKFIAGGLPGNRIVVKPNFVEDPGAADPAEPPGDYALFVGRLSSDKGIATILDAWRATPGLPRLVVIGGGPMASEVATAAAVDPRITWRGVQSPAQVRQAMRRAAVLLVPSLCYEGAPLVIVEALAAGLPVIGSNHGAPAAQIEPGLTGLLHKPGDPHDLARQINAFRRDPGAASLMRTRARECYLRSFTAEANYRTLLEVYAQARETAMTAPLRRRSRSEVPPA